MDEEEPMTTRRESPIDPEPLTVLVDIVGIVGGVASVAATYKAYAREDSPVASRGAALDLIGQATDELRHLKAQVETIQEIVAEDVAQGTKSGGRRAHDGNVESRAFLVGGRV
jgi:hypothetical protein